MGTVKIDIIKGFTEFNSVDGNILESRLIRASVSVLVGASCGLAGLGIQTLFKNPLAGPTTLGVNSGASLGVGMFYLIPGVSMHMEWLGLSFFCCIGSIGIFISFDCCFG